MTDTPEARLWQVIAAQALQDAAQGKDAAWIGSRDFATVCTLAGLDPAAVEARFDPERFRALSRAA